MPAQPAPTTKLVRIKPSNVRESHTSYGVTIKKARGWHEVPAATAALLARERMNALNPEASPFVFDVTTRQEAKDMVDAETLVADPAGTVDSPRVLEPAAPAPSGRAPGNGKKKKGAPEGDEEA